MRTLRLDDIGASSKRWEVYSRSWRPLKYVPPFKAWGPYREMTAGELDRLCKFVQEAKSQMTVVVTAAWVEADGTLVPYHHKYPGQAGVLRQWQDRSVIEIANHGLTHCQNGHHRPRWTGNRPQHREFVAGMTREDAFKRLSAAQSWLTKAFGRSPKVFVPPGNLFPVQWASLLEDASLRLPSPGLVWHDRDFILGGLNPVPILQAERFTTC